MEAQHSREKLSMVVHAYGPALGREDAGNLLGLLPPASLIYISSISCPEIIRNPLDNIPLQKVCVLAHVTSPFLRLVVSSRFDILLAQFDGLAGEWRGGRGTGGGVLLRSFVFFAIDSSAFLLLTFELCSLHIWDINPLSDYSLQLFFIILVF